MQVNLEKCEFENLAKMITVAVRDGIKQAGILAPPNEKPIILRSNRELAKALNLSMPKILEMKKKGMIPYVKLGRKSEFDLNEVKQALRQEAAWS